MRHFEKSPNLALLRNHGSFPTELCEFFKKAFEIIRKLIFREDTITNWKQYKIAIEKRLNVTKPFRDYFPDWNGVIGGKKVLTKKESENIIATRDCPLWLTITPINEEVGLGVKTLVTIPKDGFIAEYG